MNRCPHKSVMAVPHEDDPKLMAMVCTACKAVLHTFRTDELGDEGDDLGDPDEDV